MPWCDECDRFLSPNTVRDDGTCPGCGSAIITPRSLERARRGRGSSADALHVRSQGHRDGDRSTPDPASAADADPDEKTPWHFKVLLVSLILYLAWRLIQGIAWVAAKL